VCERRVPRKPATMARVRKKRARYVRLGVLALLAAAGIAMVWTLQEPAGKLDDRLWAAIVRVESGGNPAAYNPETGATGVAQIREVCVADCNRIARERGLNVQFNLADRRAPEASRRMWWLYLSFYGEQYERATGRPPTNEVYARMWNGGPAGWRKEATVEYWRRVREALRSISASPEPLEPL
jgi:hypothetical protein